MTAHARKTDLALNQRPLERSTQLSATCIPTLLTVRQFAHKHPAFPEGGLRHRIFYARTNGLEASGALVRNLGRVYLDEELFFAWVREGSQ